MVVVVSFCFTQILHCHYIVGLAKVQVDHCHSSLLLIHRAGGYNGGFGGGLGGFGNQVSGFLDQVFGRMGGGARGGYGNNFGDMGRGDVAVAVQILGSKTDCCQTSPAGWCF